MKPWTKSRIVWSALATFSLAFISLFGFMPPLASMVVDFVTMILAVATIYFRFTTTVALQK